MLHRTRALITVLSLTLGATTPAAAQLKATLIASGFSQPLGFVAHPTNPAVHFVLQKGGRVGRFVNGVVQPPTS
jgi:hypothetical protein